MCSARDPGGLMPAAEFDHDDGQQCASIIV
jgi:hypothetical protein